MESVYSNSRDIDTSKDIFIKKPLPFNKKNKLDGISLFSKIKDAVIPCVFFDPQYRGVMDKMKYGNEGSRQKGRYALEQMSDDVIKQFMSEIDRVLIGSGHLFLWIDKFHLCQGIHSWIDTLSLEIVDLITWNKLKMGMGYRTRRNCEYLLVLQKKPIRAKGVWKLHNIRDVWEEKNLNKTHPHSKPIDLQRALIESTTNENDIVIDPAAGSFSVLEGCLLSNRTFLGGDINGSN